MPQLVVVLLVTLNKIVNVKLVQMFVLLVMLPYVSNVKIQNTESFQIVSVLKDGSLMVLITVNLVIHNVLNVLELLIIVMSVPLVENKVHQNVHVHQVKLILMDSVKLVITNVRNVVNLPLIVIHVLISELMPHLVFVQLDIMMMVIILSVTHVTSFVLNVLTLLVVLSVLNGELNSHQLAHVKMV